MCQTRSRCSETSFTMRSTFKQSSRVAWFACAAQTHSPMHCARQSSNSHASLLSVNVPARLVAQATSERAASARPVVLHVHTARTARLSRFASRHTRNFNKSVGQEIKHSASASLLYRGGATRESSDGTEARRAPSGSGRRPARNVA